MFGSLHEDNLAGVVRTLYTRRDSGILQLSQGEILKRIYFLQGSIIFANSDVEEDRLGEFLVRAKKIDRSMQELATKISKNKGVRFGKTIVEFGHMSADDMLDSVIKQIQSIIYSLFLWESGHYRFKSHESPVDEDIILDLSTADIILEGIRRMKDMDAIRRGLGDLRSVLRHSENPLLLYQKISLSQPEGFVLSRVDGTTSVAEITAISPLGEGETQRCVYGLVSAGVLELGPAHKLSAVRNKVEELEEELTLSGIPKPEASALEREAREEFFGLAPEELVIRDDISAKHASLASSTHYDLLGTNKTATDVQIKKAFFEMAKKYHPDHHHSPYLHDMRGLLEELYAKITKAYMVLSDPLSRRRYDFSLQTEAPKGEIAAPVNAEAEKESTELHTIKMAKRHYREGKRYFDEMKYFDAIQCLREAVRRDPKKASYQTLLAKALVKNPRWKKQAEDHFQKALEIEPFNVDAILSLGGIYESSGLVQRAMKMYEEALSYDADNELALEKLAGKKHGTMNRLKNIMKLSKE